MTRTTTNVRTTAEKPVQRFRLARPSAVPLRATWHQDGHRILGELSLPAACRKETLRVWRAESVQETSPNPAYYTTGYVMGGVFAAAGIATLVASGSASDEVSCGWDSTPKSGDTCRSPSGALVEIGATLLAVGAGTVLGSVLVASSDPRVETKPLPVQRRVSLNETVEPCGSLAQLAGMRVTADIPEAGRWSGAVDADGKAVIELGSAVTLRKPTETRFSVESVPAGASVVAPGAPLGTLILSPSSATAAQQPRRASGARGSGERD